MLLIAIVVLLDGEVLVRRLRQVVPRRYRTRADRAGRVFYSVVGTYFAGSLFVALLAGVYVLSRWASCSACRSRRSRPSGTRS